MSLSFKKVVVVKREKKEEENLIIYTYKTFVLFYNESEFFFESQVMYDCDLCYSLRVCVFACLLRFIYLFFCYILLLSSNLF